MYNSFSRPQPGESKFRNFYSYHLLFKSRHITPLLFSNICRYMANKRVFYCSNCLRLYVSPNLYLYLTFPRFFFFLLMRVYWWYQSGPSIQPMLTVYLTNELNPRNLNFHNIITHFKKKISTINKDKTVKNRNNCAKLQIHWYYKYTIAIIVPAERHTHNHLNYLDSL